MRRTGVVAVLLVALLPTSAVARPIDSLHELRRLALGLESALRCRTQALDRHAQCHVRDADDSSLVADTVALVHGSTTLTGVSSESHHAQLRCQRKLGEAAGRFVRSVLVLRERGWPPAEAQQHSARHLEPLKRACDVLVKRVGPDRALPSVGAQCAAAVGPPGDRVDSGALVGCLTRLLGVWAERAGSDPRPLRPNVVLIVTDDQRWDAVDERHAPPGEVAMPATMDRLAGEGLVAGSAFVTTPVCSPSRASILTGQYAHAHGGISNGGPNSPAVQLDDTSTIAIWLQDAGYRTGFFGKYLNGYRSMWFPFADPYVPPGWDDWRAFDSNGVGQYFNYRLVENGELVAHADYSTDVLASLMLEFVEDAVAAEEPFLALVAPAAPHFPYVPPARHIRSLDALAFFVPPSFYEADVTDKPAWVRARPPFSLARLLNIHNNIRVLQLEQLKAVDDLVADLMDRLDALGIADDTLVIYTSDNGQAWGEHRWASKSCPYEECLRVPLIARYPRLVPLARASESTVLNLDLAPTLVELAGAAPVPGRDGRSLVRWLDGTDPTPRDGFVFESNTGPSFFYAGLRERDWKLVLHQTGERELYNLVRDPFELENLAADAEQAPRIEQMRERVLAVIPGPLAPP